MSVVDARETGTRAVETAAERLPASPGRLVALGGVALVIGAFLSVLHEVLVITGDPETLYSVVVGAAIAGTALAKLIRPRTAALLAVAAVVAGTYFYVTSLPGGVGFLTLLAPMVDDAVALLSGLSVLRIVNADVWALAAAPGPVFLAWYLGLRRRYVAASTVGGSALGVVVLTGDATVATTLAGVLGVAVAVAVGDCDRRDERLGNADGVVVVLATMVVLTLFVGLVPGVAGSLISTGGMGSGSSTVEATLVHAGDSISVAGPVELSPKVRYTVEADRETYWRVGTYDRYTGDGWVRTGGLRNYRDDLQGPPGESRAIRQRYTAETSIATLPAANEPVSIEEAPVPVRVTDAGTFEPADTLREGESYAVESRQPVASASDLRTAGTDYPEEVERGYTQLPDSVPDRVGERTSRLTANAENPYDTARVLEQWFRGDYNYSLDVERPSDDVADAFLFEMDAGYCTYFATTMVTMLRTQDVPARFVVGYTPGQQVDDGEWVVRGYNSHAWVEVYFPEHGWIRFDPTPSTPRETVRRERLSEARQEASEGDSDPVSEDVDTNESLDSGGLGGGTVRPPEEGADFPDGPEGGANDDLTPTGADGGENDSLVPTPTPQQLGVGLLVLAGLAAGARRTGAGGRLYREWWLRRPPDGDPESVVAGAYRRAVHLQERADREKRPGETPRQFLADADDRARRLGELYERARYGPGVDEEDAVEARRLLGALREEPPARSAG